jgi:uncharacterized protein (DUF952 family)
MTVFIFHITTRASWSDAQKTGLYIADSSKQDGFIHCSKSDQILRVANTFYRNQNGLVILEIDPSKLMSELRWEPGTGKADELFPHIYGSLNLEAIVHVFNFKPDPNGMFSLPSEMR